ncbi:glycerol-3-phosphate O-acyltransferase [Gymnopus androsaceus JB14]|uniref:Glycerol-3-phosphate O-acyltransferase n=1 Tax=Gymnopus androsaceus JB14 TaxID=1447944 RepID=A0A6A4I5A5_9AGAR|nr:glycerol-3-phosphate O-acyltransferase [Gymnopus androsaceus JB14]
MVSAEGRNSHLGYDASMLFWKLIVNIFFREIRPRGAFNIPSDGPVIFVGAPLYVYKETGRHVQFLAAEKSLKRKFVGFLIRLMESTDPCLVLGIDTKFTTEFTPRMQILLGKVVNHAIAEVVEVVSDTELRIKQEFSITSGSGEGTSTTLLREKVAELRATGRPTGLEFKKLPYINQQEIYRYVYERLKQGGSIGIFPEGGSHDRTDFLPFKAGVSVMALGAMANDPTCQVKIVPVGLNYFYPHKFRSRAVIEFGSAMDVPLELVEMFKQGGSEKRKAVSKLLDLIYDALKTVTFRAPDYNTLMLIQAVRRLFKTPTQHLTLGQVVELNRRLLNGYMHFKDEPRIQRLREDVLKYNRSLRDLGIRDHQVPRAQKATWKTLGLLCYRVCLLVVWAVFALPGTILNGPIFILASIISKQKAKADLAASTVKITGRDVLATWKGLIALAVAPLLYACYAFLAACIAVRVNAPFKWRILAPLGVFFALPFMNLAALKFGEAGMDVLKSLGPLVIALAPGQQPTREQLSNEVMNVIQEFAPKLYDNFELMSSMPSASSPPSPATPGLWRRKSNVGAVDAQGLGLVHPMTWLDERLFGWSPSMGRSDPYLADVQMDEDMDDVGDYDNVVGLYDEPVDKVLGNSRNSSYAELRRPRL